MTEFTDGREPRASLSIGDLAAASGLSPKALRLYDTSGLLTPRAVDPFTGYRSYGRDQVARARLIASLRGVGMPLARIAVVCDQVPADARHEIRSWWRQEEADVVSRRAAVEAVLRHLETLPAGSTKERPMTPHSDTTAPAIAVRLDLGRERPRQQDAVLARDLPGGRTLLAVADGFGDDDERAPTTLTAVGDQLATFLAGDCCCTSVPDALEAAWARAEELVSPGGGTTLTVAVIDRDRLHVAHLGDSRALIVRDGAMDPVTQDHTRLRSLVAAGRLSADEAATHPDRAILNRALAVDAPTAPDLLTRRLLPGDRIVLFTDGVHAVAEPPAVAEAATQGTAEDAAAALLRTALEAGGDDNIAIVVADTAAADSH